MESSIFGKMEFLNKEILKLPLGLEQGEHTEVLVYL